MRTEWWDIDERFRQSAPKCTTPQARENHRLQYNQAQAVRHCLESAMGSLEAADAFGTSPQASVDREGADTGMGCRLSIRR